MKPETLSLEAVADEPVPFAFEVAFSTAALDREPLIAVSPVRFAGEVSRIEGGYALSGRLAYSGRLECSRCLESYAFQEREEFSLLLRPRKAAAGEEIELAEDDLDTCFYDEPTVPVAPIIEERIQMAIPMKPLCGEDCRGLCPRCGRNLNAGACGCVLEVADPRWDALKSLKEKV